MSTSHQIASSSSHGLFSPDRIINLRGLLSPDRVVFFARPPSTKLCHLHPKAFFRHIVSKAIKCKDIHIQTVMNTCIHPSNTVFVDPNTYTMCIRPYWRRIVSIRISDTRCVTKLLYPCIIFIELHERID